MTHTTTYFLNGLCCAEEETLLRKKLLWLHGVEGMTFDPITRKATIRHSCSSAEILRAVQEAGFTAGPNVPGEREITSWWEERQQLLFAILSGSALVAGAWCAHFDSSETIIIPLFITAILTGGWKIGVKGWHAVRHRVLDMNVLMGAATIGAAAIGKWEEGAAVVFLFALSQLLELYSIERSRKAIRSLLELTPPVVSVVREGREATVRVEEIEVGERIAIRPGERIPLDGIVLSGDSSVNQAPITGESHPVRKGIGDVVYAGTLNGRGSLEVRTSRPYSDTTLARVVRLVEDAQTRRAPIQHVAEEFARYYTPTVILLAAIVALVPPLVLQEPFGNWFYRSLVLLVIACPCALVISVPVTIVSGLANAARNGILLKGGRFLEEFGKINAIAFDKTGTLTRGAPRVTDIIPLDSLTPTDILRITAAIETKSEHHLAGAVLQIACEQSLAIDNISHQEFETLTGLGIKATVDGVTYFLGSHALIEEQGICSPEVEAILHRLENEGKTTMVLGTEREPLGVIAIADAVRSDGRIIVERLHAEGIRKIIMLTGDNEGTARSIAGKTGIDEFYAEVLPEEKAAHIRRLRDLHGSVSMVGDGINDAPALAEATLGIAMGVSGDDIALETADIVLMSDNLSKLPYLRQLSRKTISIIKQNIVIALAIKLLFTTLTIIGVSTLWMAVLADDGVTLLVILNGLRVLRLREKAFVK